MPAGLVFDWHTHDDHQSSPLLTSLPFSLLPHPLSPPQLLFRETGSTPAAYFAVSTVSR